MLAIIVIVLLLLATKYTPEENTKNTSKVTIPNAAVAQQRQQEIADIEDNINNAHARLAAQHVDICPKLLQQDLDSKVIERIAEVMTAEHCDYFLYLRVGQHIDVALNNDRIEALLIVPTIHNFANGDYEVVSYDKHVIRLTYDGVTRMPERLHYDMVITVTD